MSNKTLMYLIVLMVAGVVFLLTLNTLPFLMSGKQVRFLDHEKIKGSSVQYGGKNYTLNYGQQIELIEGLNAAIPIGRSKFTSKDIPEMGQFVIEFFDNKPKLVLKPAGVIGNNLVFDVPEWNSDGWIKDVTDGKLLHLLENSHPN